MREKEQKRLPKVKGRSRSTTQIAEALAELNTTAKKVADESEERLRRLDEKHNRLLADRERIRQWRRR